MYRKETTEREHKLFNALLQKGLFAELGYCDGHKCVDIHIPEAHLNIEVDGKQHYTDPEQIMADFLRDGYSQNDGIDTLRIPNSMIDTHLDAVVTAIVQVASRKQTLEK
jgi:very-short-patch-repair endonuclease